MNQTSKLFSEIPPLFESFPVRFRYGYTVTRLDLACGNCDIDITFAELRGYIATNSVFVTDVFAVGQCKCGKITPYSIRLWDNMTYSVLVNNGEWDIGATIIAKRHKILVWLSKCHQRTFQILGLMPKAHSVKLLGATTYQPN